MQSTVSSNTIKDSTNKQYIVRFDGGSRGNPGIGGSGAILYQKQNNSNTFKEIAYSYLYLGQNTTNNQAEYHGFIQGLQILQSQSIHQSIIFQGDSTLVCQQMNGLWKVNNPRLQKLHKAGMELLGKCKDYEIKYIPRNNNQDADSLANFAMNTKSTSLTTIVSETVPLKDLLQNDLPQSSIKTSSANLNHMNTPSVSEIKESKKVDSKVKTSIPRLTPIIKKPRKRKMSDGDSIISSNSTNSSDSIETIDQVEKKSKPKPRSRLKLKPKQPIENETGDKIESTLESTLESTSSQIIEQTVKPRRKRKMTAKQPVE